MGCNPKYARRYGSYNYSQWDPGEVFNDAGKELFFATGRSGIYGLTSAARKKHRKNARKMIKMLERGGYTWAVNDLRKKKAELADWIRTGVWKG